MNAIFAYGTLRDPECLRALFGRDVATRPARLRGWCTVVTDTGYFSIVRAPSRHVDGALVTLGDDELALADAWEDAPYERVPITVHDADGRGVRAFVYVRPTQSGREPAPGACASKDRSAVLADITAFRADYARMKSESA